MFLFRIKASGCIGLEFRIRSFMILLGAKEQIGRYSAEEVLDTKVVTGLNSCNMSRATQTPDQ